MTETKTYQELINQAIRKLVIIITLSISALILVVVGVQQYVQTTHEANGQMMSLNMANIDDIPSFIHWNSQNNRHTKQNTVIRVKTNKSSITAASNRAGQEIMTTSTSKKFINQRKISILPGQHIDSGFVEFADQRIQVRTENCYAFDGKQTLLISRKYPKYKEPVAEQIPILRYMIDNGSVILFDQNLRVAKATQESDKLNKRIAESRKNVKDDM